MRSNPHSALKLTSGDEILWFPKLLMQVQISAAAMGLPHGGFLIGTSAPNTQQLLAHLLGHQGFCFKKKKKQHENVAIPLQLQV